MQAADYIETDDSTIETIDVLTDSTGAIEIDYVDVRPLSINILIVSILSIVYSYVYV